MKRYSILMIALGSLFLLGGCQNKKPVVTPVSLPPPAKGLKTVYYDFDRSNIRDDQTSSLQNNSSVLRGSSNMRVTIEGNCDERGTNEYNMALGDRRARSAKNYLINLGIDPARMNTISYGEERPVCTENNESCWWQNRRSDFRR